MSDTPSQELTSDTVSFAELEAQDVQVLPARTVLSLFSLGHHSGGHSGHGGGIFIGVGLGVGLRL
jgi:hypothetical protein